MYDSMENQSLLGAREPSSARKAFSLAFTIALCVFASVLASTGVSYAMNSQFAAAALGVRPPDCEAGNPTKDPRCGNGRAHYHDIDCIPARTQRSPDAHNHVVEGPIYGDARWCLFAFPNTCRL